MDLTKLTDEQLALNLKEDKFINESLLELSSRHTGIYYKIVNKFIYTYGGELSNLSFDKELLLKSKDYAIYQAAKKFDPSKNTKFSTFLGSRTTYDCLNHINGEKRYKFLENGDIENIIESSQINVSNLDDSINDDINVDVANKILEIIKNHPDKRVKDIFRLRYLESKGKRPTPWSRIEGKIPHVKGKNKYLTIQGCINLHDKTLNELQRKFSTLGKENKMDKYRRIMENEISPRHAERKN